MREVLAADGKESLLRLHAADGVQELAGGLHAETEEVHILLHHLHLGILPDVLTGSHRPEALDVIQDFPAAGAVDGFAPAMLPDLLEEPGIADGPAPDHQAASTRLLHHRFRLGR